MGIEQEILPEQNIQSPALKAFVLCTKGTSVKFEEMRDNLAANGFGNLPVGAAAAHSIPESSYNDALSNRPELVAGVKCIQIVGRYPQLIPGVLPDTDHSGILNGTTVFISNDIMLDLRSYGGRWQPFQKPSEDDKKSDIESILVNFLAGHEYCCEDIIEARFRCGAAACCMDKNGKPRGVAGMLELFFWFDKFHPDEIKSYVENTPIKVLQTTNFGLKWDNTALEAHVRIINSVEQGHYAFARQADNFKKFIRGAVPGIRNLVDCALSFGRSGSLGDLTGDINILSQKLIGKPSSGQWNTWRPNSISGII